MTLIGYKCKDRDAVLIILITHSFDLIYIFTTIKCQFNEQKVYGDYVWCPPLPISNREVSS